MRLGASAWRASFWLCLVLALLAPPCTGPVSARTAEMGSMSIGPANTTSRGVFKICHDQTYALCAVASCFVFNGLAYCTCDIKKGDSISLPFHYGRGKDVCSVNAEGAGQRLHGEHLQPAAFGQGTARRSGALQLPACDLDRCLRPVRRWHLLSQHPGPGLSGFDQADRAEPDHLLVPDYRRRSGHGQGRLPDRRPLSVPAAASSGIAAARSRTPRPAPRSMSARPRARRAC